jgi:hypothetical protein
MSEEKEIVDLGDGTAAAKAKEQTVAYDAAAARNRFEYEVSEDGQKFDVAHVFGPLDDDRYMQWNRDLKVRGGGGNDEINEEAREATAKLWDDLIVEVENVEYPEDADFRTLIDSQEKLDAINDLLAVAIVEPEATSSGKRQLVPKGENPTQTIVTEAYFNGQVSQQTHVLKAKTFEFEKKFQRILGKRLREEKTRGLRRKPKLEYIPQDDKMGGLYDEMHVSSENFVGATPLRFKVLVLQYIFAPKLDQKPLGK